MRSAEPHFRLVSESSGRLDYIETISSGASASASGAWRKTLLKARLVPTLPDEPDFRLAFTSGVSANAICFERELLDHHRLVLERV